MTALVTALVTSLVILVVLPLAFGNSPIDFFKGKAQDKIAQAAEDNQVPVETVERVVEGGQAAVVKAAQKLMPAVVNIEVTVSGGTGVGSGSIIREDGYIITNNHVVEGARSIQVSLADGDVVSARVIGTDPDTDLAVIKIDRSGLPTAELGSSANLAVGEVAIAIGSPEGFEQSVTTGIISALHRNLSGSYYSNPLLDVIQTDAAINPGNSGGPLANISGQVIGINTAIVSSSGGNEGIGFAIPIDTAKPVVEQLIDTGKVTHPWLGISGTTLSPEVADRFNLTMDSGALVRSVYAGGPADKAGIQQGDIIVQMDNQQITSMDDLMLFVRSHKVGDKVKIRLFRGSDQKDVEATLAAKPSNL
jgi:serine protease Do